MANCKILIVDDEIKNREDLYEGLCRDSIREDWYTLIFATTGEQALEIIKEDQKQEILLIILDLKLEGAMMDGIKFANTLAQSHIDKKIIVYTAYPEWESSFSVLATNLIIKVLKRNAQPTSYLRDLCEAFIMGQNLEHFGKQGVDINTRLIGYTTIRKLFKSLPNEQRYKLILETLRFFSPDFLKKIRDELPLEANKAFEESLERDTIKQWIKEHQERHLLPSDIPPADDLHNLWIEINERRKKPHSNPNTLYLDYYLHWTYNGENDKRYLKKKYVRLLPQQLQHPLDFPDSAETLRVKYNRYKKRSNPETRL